MKVDRIISTAQKLLVADLLKNGKVVCVVITEDCAKEQQKEFRKAGHETLYIRSQPNACTFYLNQI